MFRYNGDQPVTVMGTAVQYIAGAMFNVPEGDGGDPDYFEMPRSIESTGTDQFDLDSLRKEAEIRTSM